MTTIWRDYNFQEFDDEPAPMPGLPEIRPRFFVPPLEDKPQNPILDTLKLAKINQSLHKRPKITPRLPHELAILVADSSKSDSLLNDLDKLWTSALTRTLGIRNGTLSWDRLRPTHPSNASPTAFLSEQASLVFASARHYTQPRFSDPNTIMRYITQEELLVSLKMTVLGTSSTLHTWCPSSERFIQVGCQDGQRGFLLVDGKDEVVSSSVISRFLTIGTLMRRLEEFLAAMRKRSAKEGPTIHAFAHSLATILTYLREELAKLPPIKDEGVEKTALCALWIQYSIYEEILVALSELYGRSEGHSPQDYPKFDSSPVPLLSRVYEHLNIHLERQSPRRISAIFAYILTSASQEYLQQVGRSVGFGGQPLRKSSHVVGERHNQYEMDDEGDEDEEEEDIFEALEQIEDNFPNFFPQELLNVLPAAQKSLVLLRIAHPDHPLLTVPSSRCLIRWFWSAADIQGVWDGSAPPAIVPQLSDEPLPTPPSTKYKPELSYFSVFDMEPGSAISSSSFTLKDTSTRTLQSFIDSFPNALPPTTPTLPHLTSLVFSDLVRHASTLSSALLSLFIASTGNLNFQSHLVLLRSYLLLTAPSFKSRLLAALFSDAGEYEIDTEPHSMSIRSLRRRPSSKKGGTASQQPWAVGLSPSLLERETWPPVGADLSFFLRTVIVDSFEADRDWEDGVGVSGQAQVIEEAGWRLGFAIRDLPVGPGRDKWLNPLTMEALDFLYMDYKPPHPLEILISPDILSKYQRLFAFILRLLRVESALKCVFRMNRSTTNPFFPTLTASRKLLLHFRFVSQSFVSSLESYVFDTAIRGNFDPFIARLSPETLNPATSTGQNTGFSDIFELARCHSGLLDDILSACLLRSGQRGAGDLLRNSLELVLEFCVTCGELHRGRLEEYQAAGLIEDIYRKFRTKMTTLTKVLKGLVDKGPSSSRSLSDVSGGGERRPLGGIDVLYHLLLCLDLSDWWSKAS